MKTIRTVASTISLIHVEKSQVNNPTFFEDHPCLMCWARVLATATDVLLWQQPRLTFLNTCLPEGMKTKILTIVVLKAMTYPAWLRSTQVPGTWKLPKWLGFWFTRGPDCRNEVKGHLWGLGRSGGPLHRCQSIHTHIFAVNIDVM